jgi:hypothetical protein
MIAEAKNQRLVKEFGLLNRRAVVVPLPGGDGPYAIR